MHDFRRMPESSNLCREFDMGTPAISIHKVRETLTEDIDADARVTSAGHGPAAGPLLRWRWPALKSRTAGRPP